MRDGSSPDLPPLRALSKQYSGHRLSISPLPQLAACWLNELNYRHPRFKSLLWGELAPFNGQFPSARVGWNKKRRRGSIHRVRLRSLLALAQMLGQLCQRYATLPRDAELDHPSRGPGARSRGSAPNAFGWYSTVGHWLLRTLANRIFWHRQTWKLEVALGTQRFVTESRLSRQATTGGLSVSTVPLTAKKVANDWQTLSLGRLRTHGSARGKVRATHGDNQARSRVLYASLAAGVGGRLRPESAPSPVVELFFFL